MRSTARLASCSLSSDHRRVEVGGYGSGMSKRCADPPLALRPFAPSPPRPRDAKPAPTFGRFGPTLGGEGAVAVESILGCRPAWTLNRREDHGALAVSGRPAVDRQHGGHAGTLSPRDHCLVARSPAPSSSPAGEAARPHDSRGARTRVSPPCWPRSARDPRAPPVARAAAGARRTGSRCLQACGPPAHRCFVSSLVPVAIVRRRSPDLQERRHQANEHPRPPVAVQCPVLGPQGGDRPSEPVVFDIVGTANARGLIAHTASRAVTSRSSRDRRQYDPVSLCPATSARRRGRCAADRRRTPVPARRRSPPGG